MFRRTPTIVVKTPVLQTPETFKGGNFKAGFLAEYTPFVIASFISVAITAFDLVTDWLAFHHVKSLNLDDWFREGTAQENTIVYQSLHTIYLVFCIVATVLFTCVFIRACIMLHYKQKQFFEIRDGVPYERPWLERFSGEIFVLLLTLLHNLPISLLFLTLQAMVSCEFLIDTQHPVFYVSVLSTFISILWKMAQVVWSAGCCGKRYEYTKSRPHTALRIITFILLICTLIVTIINLVLLKPKFVLKHVSHDNHLYDKVFIDSWLDDEKLVLCEHMSRAPREPSEPSQSPSRRSLDYEANMDIINMHDLVRHHNKPLVITKPCSMNSVNMSTYLPQNMHNSMREGNMQCTTVFSLYLDLYNYTLYVNYRYRMMSENQTHCESGDFMPSMPMDDSRADLDDSHEQMDDNGGSIGDNSSSTDDNGRQSPDDSHEDYRRPPPPTPSGRPHVMTHDVYLFSDMREGATMTVPCKLVITEWEHHTYADPCLKYASLHRR